MSIQKIPTLGGNQEVGLQQGSNGSNTNTQTTILRYPAPESLHGRMLARLLSGREYTALDHWKECGSSVAADAARKLRRAGWPIVTTDRHVKNRDPLNDASIIGFYSLPATVIAATGDQGRCFISECLRIEALAARGAA